MPTIGQVVEILNLFAPAELAEDWDNVGLLVGKSDWSASKVMTCLTVTPTTADEAVSLGVNLIVSHHPLPFHPLRAITDESTAGRLLLQLITAGIGVYSPHTAFDSAEAGINQHLAIGLGLQEIKPLISATGSVDSGSGRRGWLGESLTLVEMAERVKIFLDISTIQVAGAEDLQVSRVAIACGSGGSFLQHAIARECNCLVTGEATFHTCLEAEACGIGLILPGHFASERFALVALADYLSEQLAGIEVWASRTERDPLRTV
ncbi:MAG: Nif3-like dinuclear metal center hexameric protein [Pirellulales bacterium]